MFAPRDSPAKLARSGAGLSPLPSTGGDAGAAAGTAERPLIPCTPRSINPESIVRTMNLGCTTILLAASRTVTGGDAYAKMEVLFGVDHELDPFACAAGGNAGGGTSHICVMPRRDGVTPISIDIEQVRCFVFFRFVLFQHDVSACLQSPHRTRLPPSHHPPRAVIAYMPCRWTSSVVIRK